MFLDSFFSGKKADSMLDRSPFGSFWFSPIGQLSLTGMRVTPESALALPAVFASVRVLAESFAILPFALYRPSADGKARTKIPVHWLNTLFNVSPNPFQSPFEWREMLQGHLALRGNAYCQIEPDGKGGIESLLPLHPDRMSIDLLKNGNYRYKYIDQHGSVIYYTRGEIWHLRGLSGDGYLGMSPIEVAREAVAEGLAMQSYSSRFFANDAKPGGGWIEFPGSFASTDQKKVFRETWQNMQGGSNHGKVAVLEKGMKFHEIGVNNKDAQFLESREAKVTEIARIFRIPPHKIGDLSKATFSNIEQQSIEFWQDSMLPWVERWESSIKCFLLGVDTDLDVEFDMRRMMRGDAATRSTYISTLVMASVLTPDEGREMEGYDPSPVPGMDKPLRQMNMVQFDEPPPAAPAPGASQADEEDDTPPKPSTKPNARLQAILASSAARLARRAAGTLTTTVPEAVFFDKRFMSLVAEALGVSEGAALRCCSDLATRYAKGGMGEEEICYALLCFANESKE